MKQAPDIRFIGIEPSEALASVARDKVAKLDLLCPSIMACRVAIELAHKHKQQGRAFAVRITLTLPGRELAVNRVEDEDAYVALRDAFDDMRRQVEDAMRRMQGQEKRRQAPVAGPVADESESTP